MLLETGSLKEFTLSQSKALGDKVRAKMRPQYTPGDSSSFLTRVKNLCDEGNKTPYRSQQDTINALLQGFKTKRVLGLIAEMGCGKTLLSSYAARCMELLFQHPARTLVLCPPTLISTWQEELADIFGDTVTVVDANGPDALKLFAELRKKPRRPEKPEVWISGFNRIKTSYPWEASCYTARPISSYQRLEEGGFITAYERNETSLCPRCSKDLDFTPKTRRQSCPHCREPLWGPAAGAKPVYAPVLFIKKYLRKHFHFLICDESHKLKGADTIQGAVLGQLAEVIPKALLLTGTLSGGKASDIYYLLQRAFALNYSREERRNLLPSYSDTLDFVRAYGTVEKVYTAMDADPATGRASREYYSIKEKPGISPQLLRQFFIENCVFLRITDMADALPGYREVLEFTDLPDEVQTEYDAFEGALREAVKAALKKRDMKVVGQMLSSLLAWPDMPQKGVEVLNRENMCVASAPAMDIPRTPKDERLIECVRQAKLEGRKCLIFVEYTGKWGAGEHVARLLEAAGLRPLILHPSVSTDKRLAWIRSKMSTGKYDCLIANPRLVETGMNLREFPEILFHETGYSIYVLRQASRRSWRPGQTKDVVVRFFINRNTMQETAMALIATKLEASLILEGELSDKGLVSLAAAGDSMGAELARALAGDLKVGSLEETFASYRSLEEKAMPARSVPARDSAPIAPVLAAAQATSSQKPREVWMPNPRASRTTSSLGRKVGSLFGYGSGPISGKVRGYSIELRIADDGAFAIFQDGNEVGEWPGTPAMPLRLRGTEYVILPETALPGITSYAIYSMAA